MQKFLVFINSLFAIALLFSYLSAFISPASLGVFALFGLFYPYILIINVFFLIFWLISEWRYASISFLTILLGINHISSFYGVNSQSSVQKSIDPIQIGSMNINAGYFFRVSDLDLAEKRKSTLKKIFINDDIDIFCLQESNFAVNEFVAESLPNFYNASHEKTTTSIFSKFPIKDTGSLVINERKHKSCIWADIAYNGQIIRIYSVHLYSNKLTKETEAIIAERSFGDQKLIDDVRYILGSYINSSKKRVSEIDIILDHIKQSPHPVIIAGDFNDTPQSYIYRKLKQSGFGDAFQDGSEGLGTTYAGYLPLLRIDYSFADESYFKTLDHQIIRYRMSDHYPMVSSYKLIEQ